MAEQPAILPVSPTELSEGCAVGDGLLALNNAHAQELSWLDRDRLRDLVVQSFLAVRIGEADGFLLAFDQSASYDSPNFLWFRDRYPRFVYIDRGC
jgi:predicted GNAT superfamily acetyltransferase